jgi:toxin CptA
MTTLLGVLMSRTSLCTVAGVQQCLRERRLHGLLPMLAAASASGLVLLACSALVPGQVVLPRDQPIGVRLLVGGALLGVGALVNGACYLGSVLYIGRGNANFLLTLLGLGVAARIAGAPMMAADGAPLRMAMGPTFLAGALLFALLLWVALRAWHRSVVLAAAAAGLLAGLVYALHPAWSYGVVIDSLALSRWMESAALLSAAMLFVGATLGALSQHRWQFVMPAPLRAARCLAGGFLMGWGAHLVPGGNDMLLLWAIPGLTLYGVLAYLAMVATIVLAMAGRTAVRPAPAA